MDESKELKLREPITVGSEFIDTLVFRKPRGKDMRRMPMKPDLSSMMDFAAMLCGQPPSTFDLLSAEDALAAVELVTDFLPSGQVTGDR